MSDENSIKEEITTEGIRQTIMYYNDERIYRNQTHKLLSVSRFFIVLSSVIALTMVYDDTLTSALVELLILILSINTPLAARMYYHRSKEYEAATKIKEYELLAKENGIVIEKNNIRNTCFRKLNL